MTDVKQRIYLIRHGETEFNRLGVFRGRYEVDLNDRGRRQAGEIGEALKDEGLEKLFAGPLSRARETAEIISGVIGVEIEIDEAFNNIFLGDWQGVEKARVRKEYPEEWKRWTEAPEQLVVPGGERVEDVRQRAVEGLRRILDQTTSTVGIVTHRSVIKVLGAALLGAGEPYFWKFYIDNAAYSIFEHRDGEFVLVGWNRNHHLSEKVTEVF
jgi:probable phosphoglycerate mutase